MTLGQYGRAIGGVIAYLACMLTASFAATPPHAPDTGSLWAHDNLVAWGVAPFDEKQRGVLERSEMLQSLGFRHIAYNWRAKHVRTFDQEIDTLRSHGIDVLAWALYLRDEPGVTVDWKHYIVASPESLGTNKGLTLEGLFEMFKRHGIHPQLWLIQGYPESLLKTESLKDPDTMSPEEWLDWATQVWRADIASVLQEKRVEQEASRVAALEEFAAPYRIHVELYNHNGWFGIEDNQLAVIEQLKRLGVRDVGMVYNFEHARDTVHDDTIGFPALWERMKPHVVAVNVSGTVAEPHRLYPSQGDRELEMMRTIQSSGWTGPIGLNTETGGDAKVALENARLGLDWLAAELRQPDSGGPRPFPVTP
jgi:hypothetical protein